MPLVFVYGSLLSGEGNHRVMAGARLVGEALLPGGYTLLDLGPYPALVPGGETRVRGEVYEVSDEHLEALDRFEGHPGLYERRGVQLEGGGEAFAYFWARKLPRSAVVVEDGCWRKQRAARAGRPGGEGRG